MMAIPGLVNTRTATILTLEEERRESLYWDPGVKDLCIEGKTLGSSSVFWPVHGNYGEKQGNKYQDIMILHPFNLSPVSLRIQSETRKQGKLLMYSS